jgi:hypothetical protein
MFGDIHLPVRQVLRSTAHVCSYCVCCVNVVDTGQQ